MMRSAHRDERCVGGREGGARHLALHDRPAQQASPPHQVLRSKSFVVCGIGLLWLGDEAERA